MSCILGLSLTLLLAADVPAPPPGEAAPVAPAAAVSTPAAPEQAPAAAAPAPAEGVPAPVAPDQGAAPLAEDFPADVQEQQGPSMQQMLWPIIIMLVVMWFLVMRPQKKFQRERQAMLGAMKKHDLVVTRGGIIGTVIELKQDRDEVLLEISKNVRVRVRRGAIEGVLPPDASGNGKE